jgi:hypothetical protein
MEFALLAIIAVVLYVREYKIPALFLFFFFLTFGFNLIPEELFDIGFISKGRDYALLILLGIIVIDFFCIKDYFKRDDFFKYLIPFGLFLIICILYSKFVLRLSWGEIIRTSRYQFFWMLYFVFRNLDKERLKQLLNYLFYVTVFVSIIYLFQHVDGKNILTEHPVGVVDLWGIKIRRFYNQPETLHFFALMALFLNPSKGLPRYFAAAVLVLSVFIAFHRSLSGFFILSLLTAYLLSLSRVKRIKIITVAAFFLSFVILFAGYKFIHSRTYRDIQAVLSGNFIDAETIDIVEMSEGGTFTFRIAHLFERNQYLLEHPQAMLLGAGLIPEDSKKVEKLFDFKVGLLEEIAGAPIQLETSDISYSVLFIRLGYLGTFLYLLLYIYLFVFFYKNRENKYALVSFLFLILSFGISFFSGNLLNPVNYVLLLINFNIVKKEKEEKKEIAKNTLYI